jgi:hypothetical protein
MAWTALAVVLLIAGLGAALLRRRDLESPGADWVVEPQRLCSPRERPLYESLRAAFPENPVLLHVSLAKLLRMRRSRGSMSAFLRYQRMAAPFVVCSRDLMPVVVVDVVGTPDAPRVSREREARAAALRASGLVYVSIALDAPVPNADEIRRLVRASLKAKGSPAGPRTAATDAPTNATRTSAASATGAPSTIPGMPPATPLTTGTLPRRTSSAPAFPKPAFVTSAPFATPLAAATNAVRRIFRTSPAPKPTPTARRPKVA